MAHQGKQVALSLLFDERGWPEDPSGWTGGLQVAADLSRNHADVLLIADEIFSIAGDLRTAAAVRAYAASTLAVFPEGPGHWLLRGMIERLDALEER
jgi:hypothetical protein